jgi:hypothetical protein
MSTIVRAIILMGCAGLFSLPAISGLGHTASVVEAHLLIPSDPSLLAVNRTERAWVHTQQPVGDLFGNAGGVSKPVLKPASPFSVPLEWPRSQAEEFKVAILSGA